MSTTKQKIYKRAYVEELLIRLREFGGIYEYYIQAPPVENQKTLPSSLIVPSEFPKLEPGVEYDVENAIKVFEYLQNLNKTQASDMRLWTYLSHATFRRYTMERWPLKQTQEEVRSDAEKEKQAVNYIIEHWFHTGSSRSLRRHSIARLWWATYLTVAPWEKDEDYFGSLETTDRYKFTRLLFSSQDIAQQILERRMGWSNNILIVLLEFFDRNPEVVSDRFWIRHTMKELNLVLGYRKVMNLSFEELIEVIEDCSQGYEARR
jgi:hypothetical protein